MRSKAENTEPKDPSPSFLPFCHRMVGMSEVSKGSAAPSRKRAVDILVAVAMGN